MQSEVWLGSGARTLGWGEEVREAMQRRTPLKHLWVTQRVNVLVGWLVSRAIYPRKSGFSSASDIHNKS